MDEESNIINNEGEEPKGSSSDSNTNKKGIGNFDNSVKFNNLKNNQSKQSKKPGDAAVEKLGKHATRAALNAATGGSYEALRNTPVVGNLAKNVENTAGKLASQVKNEVLGGSGKSGSLLGKYKKFYIISSIGTAILPYVVLLIILSAIILPLTFSVNEVKKFIERATNFNDFYGFKTNEELSQQMYEKADKVVETYSDLSRESLLGIVYYGFITPEEYLDSLDSIEEDDKDKLDFGEMKKTMFTMATQLVYSTVTFNNNLVPVLHEDIDPDTGKILNSWYEYECPSGTYTIHSNKKSFCDSNGVATYKDGPGSLDYSTADMCYDLVSDANIAEFIGKPKFDKSKKCVTINYETNTANSKEKVENFLRYGLLPFTYFGYNPNGIFPYSLFVVVPKDHLGSEAYKWKKMVTPFSSIAKDSDEKNANTDLYVYNIPMHKIGSGKDVDYYSALSKDDKKVIEDAIAMIDAVIDSSKSATIADKYYIPGAVSLPLDFTYEDPIENTILNHISSDFGPRTYPYSGYHSGIDFPAATGKPIYAFMDGVVQATEEVLGTNCGIGVRLTHDIDGDGIYDYRTVYCHMSSRAVNVGDIVNNGQQIGSVGSTGRSTGPHLHFEIHEVNTPVDPKPYLIDLIKNQSSLARRNSNISLNVSELESAYNNEMNGKFGTRDGVATAAKFLVDNLNGLPYFCSGYTQKIIESTWYTNQLVTDKSCSNYNKSSNYGMDDSGFVSWALTQNGFATRRYTYSELLSLGDSVLMSDSSVKVGDIAYRGNRVGIIIQINSEKAVIAYIDKDLGLTTAIVDRELAVSLFPNAILMNNVYKK